MTKFNKGDIVRVTNAGNGSYPALKGMVFALLEDSPHDDHVVLDVTALHGIDGGYGWPGYTPDTYGWHIAHGDVELVAPAKVSVPVKAAKTKRTTPVNKTALSPQCRQLLGLLEAKGSVTALEASGVYRIRSLSRRITDLKDAGYTIVRYLGKDTTGQRYARYYLKGRSVQGATLQAVAA